MDVRPIASDSLGVRSMATLVRTKDLKITIDPSAALGPSRYGLSPHRKELEALDYYVNEAHKAAAKSDMVIISHYHFDHFDLDGDHFNGKKVYAKSIESNINKSQTERGSEFKENVGGSCELVYADGKAFKHGKTRVEFSPPSAHGPAGIRLGYILMTLVDDGFKFIHASDVQGPVVKETADWIIGKQPDLIYMDGPPTLFLGWKFSYKNLDEAKENFQRILDDTKAEVIVDHHLLRDLKYAELFPFFDNKRVKTAAEFLGRENVMLEAHRKELWKSEP